MKYTNALRLSTPNFHAVLRAVRPRITKTSFWAAVNARITDEHDGGEFPRLDSLYDWPYLSMDDDLEEVTFRDIHEFLYPVKAKEVQA
jgi:hypothetical protein